MAVLTVGTDSGDYTTIESAVAAANSGDTVEVESGTYTNDFVTITENLTLEAAPGATVDLVATSEPPDGKAIVDEGGTGLDVTIQGLDISGSAVSDGNGAGIRYEGGDLSLVDDDIHGNQEGILGAGDSAGNITIDGSTFSGNGAGDGYTHNIYIGQVSTLTVENSTITDADVGHDIKSRAATTTITGNTVTDGPDGTASYEIDLPNGGNATIEDNTIEKGPNAQNPIAISYGEEGGLYSSSSLLVEGNTIDNDDTNDSTTMVQNDDAGVSADVTDNDIYGWTTELSGPGSADGNMVATADDASSACYCHGTLILTDRGERAVETLEAGDVVVTASGERQRIEWIGRRSYAGRFLARNLERFPILFRAGSLGGGLPRRDLRVSANHAMFLDGVLVPAGCLVDGVTVVRDRGVARVDYVHLELARHDVILAEGAPSETFLDDGSRGMFQNAADHTRLHPCAGEVTYCAPRVQAGWRLDAIRAGLRGLRAA